MTDNVRLLGLDVGEKRIGIAISDELGITAQARCVHTRTNLAADLESIGKMAEREQVKGFVIGLPRRTNGEEGPEAARVREFAAALQQVVGLPVFFTDERFSTVMAESAMLAADVRRKHRRQKIDQVAAAIILQGYLDRQRIAAEHKPNQ